MAFRLRRQVADERKKRVQDEYQGQVKCIGTPCVDDEASVSQYPML